LVPVMGRLGNGTLQPDWREIMTNATTTEVIRWSLNIPAEREITTEQFLKEDLTADSLDMVELTMSLEWEFGLEIPDEDFCLWATVGDVIAYVEGRLA